MAIKVADVAPQGYALDRATVRQRKTGRPVKFDLTDQTREAVDTYARWAGKTGGDYLFDGRGGYGRDLSTRQYAGLVCDWLRLAGLDPASFGTRSLRRTKATLIYRRTGKLRAVLLLLGHTKIESTDRDMGVEGDDAVAIADKVDI